MQPAKQASTAIKRVSILGSTGSVGCHTLDVIAEQSQSYHIVSLTAYNNAEKLIEQARQFQPEHVVIGNEAHYQTVKSALAHTRIQVGAGEAALLEAASRPADWVMAAMVGVAGIRPLMKAIEQGSTIAFANKECLVCTGDLLMQACQQSGAVLLPVDSEHNAIFQLFDASQKNHLSHITLTASGGPFRQTPLAQLANVTAAEAVRHPNWQMGAKISVDSATMMNKALEMIEAHHLFQLPSEQIDVLIHPESVVHSLVHYQDGSVLAQLGSPDMRIPIAYTLSWPERMSIQHTALDLAKIGALHFEEPDTNRFPALRYARDAMQSAASAAITMNAANEVAVEAFLQGRIGFCDITRWVDYALTKDVNKPMATLEDALYCDAQTRQLVKEAAQL